MMMSHAHDDPQLQLLHIPIVVLIRWRGGDEMMAHITNTASNSFFRLAMWDDNDDDDQRPQQMYTPLVNCNIQKNEVHCYYLTM